MEIDVSPFTSFIDATAAPVGMSNVHIGANITIGSPDDNNFFMGNPLNDDHEPE